MKMYSPERSIGKTMGILVSDNRCRELWFPAIVAWKMAFPQKCPEEEFLAADVWKMIFRLKWPEKEFPKISAEVAGRGVFGYRCMENGFPTEVVRKGVSGCHHLEIGFPAKLAGQKGFRSPSTGTWFPVDAGGKLAAPTSLNP